jgi:hypothetical protein
MARSNDFPRITSNSTAALRSKLAWLRARYDDGKVSPAVFAVIREIETSIAWTEHSREVRL